MQYNKNTKHKKGCSKKQSMMKMERRQYDYISRNDTKAENSMVLKYVFDNKITITELAQELKMNEQVLNEQLSRSMTPERIMKYCNAVDRIKQKRIVG